MENQAKKIKFEEEKQEKINSLLKVTLDFITKKMYKWKRWKNKWTVTYQLAWSVFNLFII